MAQSPAQRRYAASPKGRAARRANARRNAAATRAASAARKREHKARLTAIKLERGCIDCGYNAHPAALDFDHRDPSTKVTAVSHLAGCTWTRVEAEIAKCDVRCANCHRIRGTTEGHHQGKRSESSQMELFDGPA